MTPTIDFLLNSAFLWFAEGNDFRVETIENVDDELKYVNHYVKREDLYAIDSRLPPVFDATLEYTDKVAKKGVPPRRNILGLKIKQLRSYWDNPSLMSLTINDLTIHLSGISEVNYRSGQSDVELSAYGYVVEHIEIGSEKVAYYTSRFRETFYVSKEWMVGQFPHWEERYEMATTMGYTGIELAEMVCIHESLFPTVASKEITFE